MRLADLIIEAAQDRDQDGIQVGALSSMARSLQDAQRFEIGPAMLQAADRVRKTRPATMEAALPMVRFPYRRCWFEWLGADVVGDRGPTPGKPTPQRLGVLVDCVNPNLQAGFATWAWVHPGSARPVVCPIGTMFDESPGGPEHLLGQLGSGPPMTEETVRDLMGRMRHWKNFADDPREVAAARRMEHRVRVVPTCHTAEMYEVLNSVPGGHAALDSALGDLEGEPPFLASIIILLNSRNVVYREPEEDLSRLNRARAKARKRPLLPFVKTTIVLSRVQTNRAGSDDPVDRRRHLVMGHFKVRATGVFWWSPHPRGSHGSVKRTHYAVEADQALNRDLESAMTEG